MAEQEEAVMPSASPRRSRPVVTATWVALAALVGAGVVYVVLRPGGSELAEPSSPNTTGPTSVTSVGNSVPACEGGPDPATAVATAVRAPATVDGAVQAAAGAVRFTESKAFGAPTALQTIQQLADPLGSSALAEYQKAQAPYRAKMTVATAKVGQGAFTVTSELPMPTVTVLTPVEWATAAEKHYDWHFIDVKLQRTDDRWAVVAVRSTVSVSEDLQPLRGAEVQQGDLDRHGAALSIGGFRRFSGDC